MSVDLCDPPQPHGVGVPTAVLQVKSLSQDTQLVSRCEPGGLLPDPLHLRLHPHGTLFI